MECLQMEKSMPKKIICLFSIEIIKYVVLNIPFSDSDIIKFPHHLMMEAHKGHTAAIATSIQLA